VKQNAGDVRIKSVTIATGKKSKAHRGFCFIDFHNAAEAIMVADSLDGAAYEDRVLNSNVKEVVQDRKKVKKERRDITKSVFVANLDRSLTEFEVSDMCEDLLGEGVVKKIDMPIEKQTGRRRGIAYIEFFSEETVEKAIEEFTDLDVLGRLLICTEVKDPRLLKKEESD
jgi:RNA recognition motif-containing protein